MELGTAPNWRQNIKFVQFSRTHGPSLPCRELVLQLKLFEIYVSKIEEQTGSLFSHRWWGIYNRDSPLNSKQDRL